MPNKNNNRMGRIDEEYRKELSQIIGFELKNSSITGMISVTKVKVTPDLKYAKVYVSIFNSKNIKDTMEGLKKSSGFIRTELAKRINLRNTPELIFEIDDSMEYGAKIDSILKEIMPNKWDTWDRQKCLTHDKNRKKWDEFGLSKMSQERLELWL